MGNKSELPRKKEKRAEGRGEKSGATRVRGGRAWGRNRGKSITARFNTWNACDFEVDKGSRHEMLSAVFLQIPTGYEISRMGY